MTFYYLPSIFLYSSSIIILFVSVRNNFGENVRTFPCSALENSTCDIWDVKLDPCPEANENEPCTVYRGTNVTLSAKFTPHFSASKLIINTYMRVLLTDIPDIDEDHDGCKFTPCPIEAGKQYNFNYSRYVNLIYPATPYLIKGLMTNAQNDSESCCFLLNVILV